MSGPGLGTDRVPALDQQNWVAREFFRHCPLARRQATAVTRAAPLPDPSSDCRKVTPHSEGPAPAPWLPPGWRSWWEGERANVSLGCPVPLGHCPRPARHSDSLRVQLVEGPIHPTDMVSSSRPRFSRIFSTTAATPAPQSWAALFGHSLAYLQDHQSIVRGQGQPQVLQDGSGPASGLGYH